MSNSKRLLIDIGGIFFAVMFSQWMLSLEEGASPFLMRTPLKCIALAILMSIVGGYLLHRFKLKTEEKERQKNISPK